MEFGLQPGTILALAIALFLVLHFVLRAPLPLSFIVVAAVTALIGDFGIPFRHLVEGGFGFINLVLALFAGAFFGHMMRGSGAADAAATGILRLSGARLLPLLTLAALPLFPTVLIDPASPLILVIGGLAALPMLPRGELRKAVMATFTGTPLLLAAVLVTVGILVQIMTLTGVRGWLVISTMSLTVPWNYVSLALGMPLLGGALTAMSVSDVIGVPAAFSFIGQDMIINVAALSAIASLAEFVPPTAIAAALSCYVVGGGSIGQVIRRAWPPMMVLLVLALLMLIFARQLTGILT